MQAQNKTPLLPGAGSSDFREYINRGFYYVDKTGYLRTLFLDTTPRTLILRPRRFGKTLLLSTMQCFLEMNYKNPDDISEQQRLFKGLKVAADQEFCEQNMGQYPVLSLSLKGVEGRTFERAYAKLAQKIYDLVSRFAWLLESDRLEPWDKRDLQMLLDYPTLRKPEGQDDIERSLKVLSSMLLKHTGRLPVLLIDEYDVPLQKAALGGYYDDMIGVVKSMLEYVVKDNAEVSKVIMTGCLKASKESIFTDMNNVTVNSVLSQDGRLDAAFGFTPDEVHRLLENFGAGEAYATARKWYDGYNLNGQDIFCPWDVISYAYDLTGPKGRSAQPQPYWNKTSDNSIIIQFLPDLSSEDADRMQELLDGKDVKLHVNESLIYKDLSKHLREHFWSILVFTGYLTLAKRGSGDTHEFRIPNTEVRQCFNYNIHNYYDQRGQGKFGGTAKAVVTALLSGDSDSIIGPLNELLRGFVSVRDSATRAPKENFYQGFINGLFAAAGGSLVSEYSSNRESGDGYADITFKSFDESTGVVIELKLAAKDQARKKLSEEALMQIAAKDYARELRDGGVTRIFAYGIAFCKRQCTVSFQEIPV